MKRTVNKRLSRVASPLSTEASRNGNEALLSIEEKPHKSLNPDKKKNVLPSEVHAILHKVISEVNSRSHKPNGRLIHHLLIHQIMQENELRDSWHQLPCPHISTVYRVINKVNSFLIVRAKTPRRYYVLDKAEQKTSMEHIQRCSFRATRALLEKNIRGCCSDRVIATE
ncbi:MAG: hypothetical protein ABSA46_17420 [Thermodesulfovibrionales bacterium]|jgi:hypothetical protein